MAADEEVRIVYMPITELKGWKRNPKLHDLPNIRASLVRFGFVQPIALDETTHRIVAGHGRLEAVFGMFRAGEPPPRRVKVKKGTWHVPVLRGATFQDEEEAEAYLLADNFLTEFGGWDKEELAEMLRDAPSLEGTGLDAGEVERILQESQAALESSMPKGKPPKPEGELPRRWAAAPDAVTLTVGRWRFDVPKDVFLPWEEALRQEVGFEKDAIIAEIKRRLGMP